ncbi:M56 family metallopeptidase [Streptomyces zhihengii]|uniref:M56 family metallopeptidase n=1 Tax=Streptomyces zhihengii TaxID=1818004 RepID=A0ABS2ULL0_9ACTN|nr:M56 family metallopeptidase [Streptomyces zhihengii]MBM9617595.1 M56 family metallopeptidase [Streptomyces zhihengii]
MTTAVLLAALAVVVGVLVPSVLVRAGWPHRAPRHGVVAWQVLTVTFLLTAALSVYELALRERHIHDGLVGFLSACGLEADAPLSGTSPTWLEIAALAAPGLVLLWPLLFLVRSVVAARRARRDHLRLLRHVGREAPEYDALIVDHDEPAAYCVPARRPVVVITRGACDILTGEQIRAVVAHERAHLRGRHHLLHLAGRAFAGAFPGLPLARHAQEQTSLLLEMLADDRALHGHSSDALATALCEVAAGRAPAPALGAGGPGTLLRLHRVLDPGKRPPRFAWIAVLVLAAGVPMLPLAAVCGPV